MTAADQMTAKAEPHPGPSFSHDFGCTHDPCRCVLSVLPRITYQPGWSFEWQVNDEGIVLLHMRCSAPFKSLDSVTGAHRGDYWVVVQPPMPFDPQWLLDLLAWTEDHERREWLKIDGIAPFYPHDEDGFPLEVA